MSAPNWSQPLPRPIIIPEVMKLATLADVRVREASASRIPPKFTRRQFASMLRRAAQGKKMRARSPPRCRTC